MRGLQGKRVLVTGGASGIGRATAVRFLEEGSRVWVLDRDPKARAELERQLPELAGTSNADVSELKQVETAWGEAVGVMGGVDILINNAGISTRHRFLDITPAEWNQVLAVNLTGAFYAAQTAARPVSYTHLDVYKRQVLQCGRGFGFLEVHGRDPRDRPGAPHRPSPARSGSR